MCCKFLLLVIIAKQMAQRFSPDNSVKKFSFADVEGVDEAKEEIKEIVEFLRNPQKFLKMGVKLPTGKPGCSSTTKEEEVWYCFLNTAVWCQYT